MNPVTPEQRAQYQAAMTKTLDERIAKNKKFLEYAAAFDLVWRGDELAGTKPFGPSQVATLEQAAFISERKKKIEEDLTYCDMLRLALQDEWALIETLAAK